MGKTRVPLTRRRFLETTAVAGAAATALPRKARAQSADNLRVRSYGDLQVLDPGYLISAPDTDIMDSIFNKLVTTKVGDEWGWELDAAESIEIVDATHINFTLKSGYGWTNGFGEMTVDDVKFSYERIADPAMESPYTEDWKTLDHVEVKDGRSGTIVLKEAFAPLWSTTLPAGSGMIMCRKAVEALEGKRFTTSPPATSGAYTIKEWVPKQKTVLVANPNHGGAKPAFSQVTVLPIEDGLTAESGFMAGDLDFTNVEVSSLPNLRENLPDGVKLIEKPSLKYTWIGINQENPQFADVRVRRAVQLAVDVDAILEAAYFGVAAPATGIIPPGLVGHREANLYSGKRDLAKAKELLAEAGFPNGFKARIDLLNKQTYLSAVQVLQSNLAEIGIEAEIMAHDSGVWWTMGDQATGEQYKELQIMYNRFSSNPDPGWYTMWFTAAQVGVWNWERWASPEFDALHAAALVELDPAKRDGMYQAMQDLMEESGCYTFITHELTGAIYRDNIVPALQPDGTMVWKKFTLA
ncbi:MAG: twin-arginine translocation signal domain-containing protein [Alphaproteobacteria bacterium]|nr:twin-arginine translocation signal domain-containing protein [Alphaproteobacteria bacterium]